MVEQKKMESVIDWCLKGPCLTFSGLLPTFWKKLDILGSKLLLVKKNRNASLSEVYNKVDTFTGDISVA